MKHKVIILAPLLIILASMSMSAFNIQPIEANILEGGAPIDSRFKDARIGELLSL